MSQAARALAAGGLCAMIVTGCASLDPAADQERAAELVVRRSGEAVEANWLRADAAAEWDGRSPLRVEAAVRCALSANPEVRAGLERIAASRAELVQAGLLPNPVLNVSLGFPLGGETAATSVGVSAVQQLAWMLNSKGRRKAATAELEAEVLLASDRALALAAEVRSLHVRLVIAQRMVQELKTAASGAEAALDLGRRAAAAGEASSIEVNRRSTRLIERQVEVAAARTDVSVLKRELLARMGRAEAAAEWEAAEGGAEVSLGAWTEDRVVELARSQRLDVASSMARAEAARVRAGLAKSDVWSDLEAGAGYTRDEEARDEFGPELTVPIPIFDTGAARTARAAAEARIAVSEAQGVTGRAVQEARSAWVRAAAARELLDTSAARLVETADQSLSVSRRAYEAGALELTGLLEAEESAVHARIRRLELEKAAALEWIELERAVGGRLRE